MSVLECPGVGGDDVLFDVAPAHVVYCACWVDLPDSELLVVSERIGEGYRDVCASVD